MSILNIKEKARLLHLTVVNDKRKQGIASQLLKECKIRLLEKGITNFYSCVNVNNFAMAEFLYKHGFKPRALFHRFETELRADPPPIGWDYDYSLDE